jgi:hypothetical protein
MLQTFDHNLKQGSQTCGAQAPCGSLEQVTAS